MIGEVFAIYFCTVCNHNIADPRGWPVLDCLHCGADPDKLEEEHRPTEEQIRAAGL